MTKPWEETWWQDNDSACREVIRVALDVGRHDAMQTITSAGDDGFAGDRARVQLAACAPEMARMLLEVEWNGSHTHDYDYTLACCVRCGGLEPDVEKLDGLRDLPAIGHAPDCALDALLRKAVKRAN